MIYGLDIGGTKIEFVVFDDALDPLEKRRVDTPAHDYARFLDAIVGLIAEADHRLGTTPRVGLGLPGLVGQDGRAFCANLPDVTGRHVAADVATRIGRVVASGNDTRCFALSEAIGGAGDGRRIVFGAILGTGAAGGLVIDGKLEQGGRGIAAEYGHLPLPATIQREFDLPFHACGCGLEGCFEAYIGGPGLLALAQQFGAVATDTRALAEAWQAQDAAALRTRDAFLAITGAALANVVKLCDPDILVMGGGLSLIPDVIDLLPMAIERHLFTGFSAPPVVPAHFGDASGVRGAAIMARGHAA
jgi:N-acetylglucosamine kinase